ncbi:hypothetical protein D3OALGA1CA_2336 [Olavius algarvensis associated proteobacterium Delta 3]|nr:hypothetical protein D3OALGA1CA_2336 [Olavius algarvensis associated proteobacterium Delta 3]
MTIFIERNVIETCYSGKFGLSMRRQTVIFFLTGRKMFVF